MSRVLVIGCGSIGSRRARLLDEMGHSVSTQDTALEVAWGVAARHLGSVYHSFADALDDADNLDAAFICTPAETHIPVALQCLKAGIRGVFIEKPLSVSTAGIQELQQAAEGRTVMVACNMRFAYCDSAKDWARGNDVTLVQQKPLSEWRYGAEAYRGNGIALEAATHELDLAYAFNGPGRILNVQGDADRLTATIRHDAGPVSQVKVDWSEGITSDRYITIHGGTFANVEPDTSDDMYRKEMAHFLDCVQTRAQPCNTVADAAHVLDWALQAREVTR